MNFWHTDDGFIHELEDHQIFVFGSNRQGIHGAGAAKIAVEKFGAEQGNCRGLQGQSYALPTVDFEGEFTKMDFAIEWLSLLATVTNNPELEFWVTAVGTGLAGWDTSEICEIVQIAAPLVPDNVLLPPEWEEYLT